MDVLPSRLFSPLCCTAMLMRADAIWSNCPAWHSAKCQKRFCLMTKTVLISILFLSVGGEYRFITPQQPPEMTFLTLFFGVRLEADKPDNVCFFSFLCEGSLRNPFLYCGSFFLRMKCSGPTSLYPQLVTSGATFQLHLHLHFIFYSLI